MSAKFPVKMSLLQELDAFKHFTEEEIAIITTEFGRGKPSKARSAAMEKWQSFYAAHRSAVVKEKIAEATAKVDPKAVLADTRFMFGEMMKEAARVVKRTSVGFVVSGAPGIGKTYTLENYLDGALNNDEDARFRKLGTGHMTPVNLYVSLYMNRFPGHVVMLDDMDSVWDEPAALNLLKGALESKREGEARTLSWFSETSALQTETGAEIPKSFQFDGAIVFISNLNLTERRAKDKSLDAVLNRMAYIDLRLHDRVQVKAWVLDGIRNNKVLDIYFRGDSRYKNWKPEIAKEIADFIEKHGDKLVSLSYRSAIQITKRRLDDKDWEKATLMLDTVRQ